MVMDLQRREVGEGRRSQRGKIVVGQKEGVTPRREEVKGRQGQETPAPTVHRAI